MIIHRYGEVLAIRLDEGEEAISAICGALASQGIVSGIIPTFIGALKGCRLIQRKGYEVRIESHVEVVGNGNVSLYEGKPFIHLHVSAGNDEGTWVGHLVEGYVDIFCEAMIIRIGGRLSRKYGKDLAKSGVTVPYVLDFR